MASEPSDLVDLKEAASLCHEAYETTRRLVHERDWEIVGRYRGKILVRKSEVVTWGRAYRGGNSFHRTWIRLSEGLSAEEAALLLGASLNTFRQRYRAWLVPFYKTLSGRVYFQRAELEVWRRTRHGRKVLGRNR